VPELPEVEVLRRSLEPRICGKRIEAVRVWRGALREPVKGPTLRRRLVGRRVLDADRRAKYLLLHVEGGSTLVVHLGMSGRLTLVEAEKARQVHEHVGIFLDSGERLRFRDPRRFGLVLALPTSRLMEDRHFRHLGVEPLEPSFSGRVLEERAQGRRGPVKNYLMDASVAVGVGNIYASEALFGAGIHPRRSAGRISSKRWQRLADSVRRTLEQAIAQGGTTLNDFSDSSGEQGTFQVSLEVYDRSGQACSRCGAVIRKIVQAGRSTYYCPGCQR
jgi:formamidopyrimidine-DNA glycosylase